jgi:hypothetical protein
VSSVQHTPPRHQYMCYIQFPLTIIVELILVTSINQSINPMQHWHFRLKAHQVSNTHRHDTDTCGTFNYFNFHKLVQLILVTLINHFILTNINIITSDTQYTHNINLQNKQFSLLRRLKFNITFFQIHILSFELINRPFK